jgi:hypothetical protein
MLVKIWVRKNVIKCVVNAIKEEIEDREVPEDRKDREEEEARQVLRDLKVKEVLRGLRESHCRWNNEY